MVNGELSPKFKVTRGVRQGDPLSCLLFDLVSRPVLPDRELTKGGSAITSGCQQCARAMKLRYVAWWWRSRERKLTGFGSGFGHCLASVSTSRQGSEKNPKGSGSGTRLRRDGENEGQRYGKYLSWLSDWGTKDKRTTTYTMSGERKCIGTDYNQGSYVWRGTKYVTRFRWYRVDGDGELRVSDGGNEREVRVMYERKRETGN